MPPGLNSSVQVLVRLLFIQPSAQVRTCPALQLVAELPVGHCHVEIPEAELRLVELACLLKSRKRALIVAAVVARRAQDGPGIEPAPATGWSIREPAAVLIEVSELVDRASQSGTRPG